MKVNMKFKKLIYSLSILTIVAPLSICASKNHGKKAQLVTINKQKTTPPLKQTQEELNTALINATISGDKEVVKTLLAKGANVNTQDNYGDTALIMAAVKKNKEMIERLLAKGANVNIQNNYGNTALIIAVRESFS